MNPPPRPTSSSRRIPPKKRAPSSSSSSSQQSPTTSQQPPSSSPSKSSQLSPSMSQLSLSSSRRLPSMNQPSLSSSPSTSSHQRLPSVSQLPLPSSLSTCQRLPSSYKLPPVPLPVLLTPSLPATNQPPSTSSSSSSTRLLSFRDMNGIHQALLNRARAHNQKTYVPHLSHSRTIQPKLMPEETAVPVTPKTEPESTKENRRGRRERKVLEAAETFVPETKPQKMGANLGVKRESIDRCVLEKVFNDELPTKFEVISLSATEDLPVPVPEPRFTAVTNDARKVNPLLTDVIKFDGSDSSLYLLKTPRYVPGVIDSSNSQPKSGAKETRKACSLNDLLEGQIGKLQILKSGRLRLVLGDCKFWLQKGVKVNFHEELASVEMDPESKTGDIVSMGEIKERLILVPDVMTNLSVQVS